MHITPEHPRDFYLHVLQKLGRWDLEGTLDPRESVRLSHPQCAVVRRWGENGQCKRVDTRETIHGGPANMMGKRGMPSGGTEMGLEAGRTEEVSTPQGALQQAGLSPAVTATTSLTKGGKRKY